MSVKRKNTLVDNTTTPRDAVIDVQLDGIKKQSFRFNNDDSMILELNTSDAGILTRLDEAYVKLDELTEKLESLETTANNVDSDSENEATTEQINSLSTQISAIDKDMREIIDNIFDAPVSSTLVKSGTMWDPIDGKFRYEHIIEKLTGLYEENIKEESRKMRARISKHTKKYNK